PTTTPTTGSLYPPAPYDCAEGVPAGPPAARVVEGVLSTEDFAFDVDGWLVAADFSQNLVNWAPDGTPAVFSPGAGETRGVDVLPDRDLVCSNPDLGRLFRVERATGAVSELVDLSMPSASGIDVAKDGTIVVNELNGFAAMVDPAGGVHPFARLPSQGYGAAFSVDETRAYLSSYGDRIYTTDRQPDGSWSEPAIWVDHLATSTLSGLVVDACDNLYAISSYTCQLWRITPDGEAERLTSIDVGPSGACPSLAFGRGLGGWDAYKLYVSTYGEVVELDVGVPGRPR
ncbi:MAG: hypothetical protein ABMB14_21700, partial [Myxococcota bacterium]